MSVNYAAYEGIHKAELPAAIIFSVVYAPLLSVYLFLSFKKPTYVWRSLVIFSLFRMVSFVLRAVLSGSSTAGTSLGLFIAQQVIYSIGFFGLLYSAYTLVLDRDTLLNGMDINARGILGRIIYLVRRTRILIRIVLLTAIVLGIVGGIKESSTNPTNGEDFRHASLYIFLVVACWLAVVTIVLSIDMLSSTSLEWNDNTSFGKRHGILVLMLIGLLCVIREAFVAATANNVRHANNPKLFYPLVALTEFIAALLFLVPGLVPTRQELRDGGVRDEKGNRIRAQERARPPNGYTEASSPVV